MKKLLVISGLFYSLLCNSQTVNDSVSVEKSIFGIQTGFLGIWGQNELRLSNKVALRSEIGFDASIWGGSFYEQTTGESIGFAMLPVITVEPRYYYNLNRRNNKLKKITNNSGNFLSLKTSYYPDWFVISNIPDQSVVSSITMSPTWGIRRQRGKHFNFEAGLGIGVVYFFDKGAAGSATGFESTGNLHLRIGYTF